MIRLFLLVSLLWLAVGPRASALIIQLDYTYDQADGGNFFGTHPAAKASLEQAAADLSAAITSSLTAVNQNTFTGSSGGSTATIDWDLFFSNPVTGADVTIDTFTLAANTVRIYVGMQKLTGSTLGQGGPAFGAIGLGSTGGSPANAMNIAEAASNTAFSRGGSGPTLITYSGSFAGGYSVSHGALAGTLWFDNDTDNNGTIDSESILDNFWHFELSPSIEFNQNDFYSVALHEMLHALGMGTSETWTSLHSGTTWLGSQAKALNGGSGTNLLASDGDHLRSGLMSQRLSDGTMQEVVMDPSITTGTRKSLTQMDLAFLRDIGYTTVPEPSVAALLAVAVLGLSGRRKNRSL